MTMEMEKMRRQVILNRETYDENGQQTTTTSINSNSQDNDGNYLVDLNVRYYTI